MSIECIRYALNGPAMGSRWSAMFYAGNGLETASLRDALQTSVETVEQQMSIWRPGSDLNRLNQAPVGEWVSLPEPLLGVLSAGLAVGKASDGRFDICVGGLVAAHGFGPADGTAAFVPSLESLDLDLPNHRACRRLPVRVDLNAIAKGYGVDELARTLKAHGLSSWLVGIDGEMHAQGTKPDGSFWAVGIERPDRTTRDVISVVELSGAAIATSGNYRHFRVVNGAFISHTMNPRAGAPLQNRIASVTVLAPNCMMADAWATALMVAGPHDALQLAEAHHLRTQIILDDMSVLGNMTASNELPVSF